MKEDLTKVPIIVKQTFSTDITKVWSALTVLAEMQQWYFPMLSSFEPVIGFETKFTVSVDDRIYPHIWKITEVEAMKKIAYEWTFEGYVGKSISTFTLHDIGSKTELALEASVLESFPDNIPEFKRESSVAGWTYLITDSLKGYLEKNK